MKPIIDANVILRYLLDDHPQMADEAERVIDMGAETLPEIIAEVVYVLQGVYKMPRKDIKECILGILSEVEIKNYGVMFEALHIYEKYNLDFVDCVLAAYKCVENREIFTFDKKLNKVLLAQIPE